MFINYLQSVLLLLFSIVCFTSGAAAAPNINLNVVLQNKSLLFTVASDASAAGCVIQIFGADTRRKLSGARLKGKLISSTSGSARSVDFITSRLPALKRQNGKRRIKVYFSAAAVCPTDQSQSGVFALKVRTKKSGLRNVRKWLRRVARKTTPLTFRLQQVFSQFQFNNPVDFQNDGSASYVVEQGGIIKQVSNNGGEDSISVFLNIADKIISGGERGLLGLAFHPDFSNNRYFYVNYTAKSDGSTTIERYQTFESDPSKADSSSALEILNVKQPYSNHNAGQLAFGPDGYLYIGLGDGGSGGDPDGNGQNTQTLLGSMLRIDVNQTSAGKNYAIPPDNPFVGSSTVLEEIYAYGLRNPWRYSFDSADGTLWLADVGQSSREEINIITGSENYGWNTMEGTLCFRPSSNCDTSGLTLPIYEYGRSEGVSVTGGYVYRGASLKSLQGAYVFGDFGSGKIWALRIDRNNQVQVDTILDTDLSISSFGIDSQNELYVLDLAGGGIYLLQSS